MTGQNIYGDTNEREDVPFPSGAAKKFPGISGLSTPQSPTVQQQETPVQVQLPPPSDYMERLMRIAAEGGWSTLTHNAASPCLQQSLDADPAQYADTFHARNAASSQQQSFDGYQEVQLAKARATMLAVVAIELSELIDRTAAQFQVDRGDAVEIVADSFAMSRHGHVAPMLRALLS